MVTITMLSYIKSEPITGYNPWIEHYLLASIHLTETFYVIVIIKHLAFILEILFLFCRAGSRLFNAYEV